MVSSREGCLLEAFCTESKVRCSVEECAQAAERLVLDNMEAKTRWFKFTPIIANLGGGPYSGSRVAGFGGYIGTTAAVPMLSLFPGILWLLMPVTGLPTVNSTRPTQVHTVRAYLAELTIKARNLAVEASVDVQYIVTSICTLAVLYCGSGRV
ncbi:unnamed protein product [Sphagnum jensenii]|uniref:Uncharacterized protein n=1 Tax=Sphagnum jensenii TaxID=128206 RepID=A0ABP0XDA4_9BRYO